MALTVRVQTAPFDTGAELGALLDGRTDVGGVGCFVGVVRDSHAGQPIRSMTLEHYPGMTERALRDIAAEAIRRWTLLGCTLVHRFGTLLPGDPIVLVLTTSAHREAALQSTAFLIDWLKTRAPFWKHETMADGSAHWVMARTEDDAAAAKWTEPTAPPSFRDNHIDTEIVP